MGNLRFTLMSLALFALAFIGVSWASKGFPVMTIRAVPLKPDARIPTFEESVKKGLRRDWENSKTSQSDGDKERDKLRIALLQASIGYKLSPCDPTMKKNLVAALTNYTNAWAEMAGCKSGICSGDDKRLEAAAAAFKTPADVHVHEALREALDQGGVSRDDFPRPLRMSVFMWSGMPFGAAENACIASRVGDNRR